MISPFIPILSTPRTASQSRGAFTLMELLVVIAIIAIIAALAIPAINGNLKKAKNMQNLANLREMGTLAAQYAEEYNGAFVPGKGEDGQQWQVQLARLISKNQINGIWDLPDFSTNPPKMKREFSVFSPPWYKLTSSFWDTGYGVNMQIGLPDNDKPNTAESWGQLYTAAGLSGLSKRPLIFSWPTWNAYPTDVTPDSFARALSPTGQLDILFCDGHVGSVGKNDMALFKKMLEDPSSN